jgi:hypothetical protein
MDDVLAVVQASLADVNTNVDPSSITNQSNYTNQSSHSQSSKPSRSKKPVISNTHDSEGAGEDDHRWENDANDVMFDDGGEGAGVDGDLDMEDDD